MWTSGHWPSPGENLHPTCLMCGRLVCGPHKQMVQQVVSDYPLRSLTDGTTFLKLNPERLCRRISDPWMLESVALSHCCTWEVHETEALVATVKQIGYLGWDAVKEQLQQQEIIRTSDQCQHHWREVCEREAKSVPSMRTLENRSLGDRWRKRDESILAELEDAEREDADGEAVSDLGAGLIMWAPLLACYLSPRQTLARPPATLLPEMIQEDFLIGLSAFFRTPLVDRTGILNQEKHQNPSRDGRRFLLDCSNMHFNFASAKPVYGICCGGADELIVRCSADSIAEFYDNVLLKLAERGGICLEPLADSEE
eukprot:Skav207626  [mRNA]  locus=scaffold1878:333427:336281:- [translate_table: standard]